MHKNLEFENFENAQVVSVFDSFLIMCSQLIKCSTWEDRFINITKHKNERM